jgi:hypothetical protein
VPHVRPALSKGGHCSYILPTITSKIRLI